LAKIRFNKKKSGVNTKLLFVMSELNYEAIAYLTEVQIEDLCHLYQSEWWSKGRHKTDVQKMLQHSNIIVAFCHPETRKLLAFAKMGFSRRWR
jgi:hypothetical protein